MQEAVGGVIERIEKARLEYERAASILLFIRNRCFVYQPDTVLNRSIALALRRPEAAEAAHWRDCGVQEAGVKLFLPALGNRAKEPRRLVPK
jgi:hypothetical protein